ncbi:Diaminopimelate epimerase-like protein [Guyanagaster necrorhizus]|uniref:Diaminopimelate epimerase-like protein n=1 Tax=Guyanagaster necrorhizus TaxID=856835 RepID=A0A9P7W6L4_9AGAR|nr:Diaminopimelate epimerase-like protein [Guyanagaster necrorhizus MCA 3950]KAG7452201.1 Diaminopimelate epimerase-like protein [Guyanagaster necrorhizus MCA 3950]
MSRPFPFYLVSAFSNDAFGGNPAAVVFLDELDISDDGLMNIADNLNQPGAAFLFSAPPSTDPRVFKFRIRYIVGPGVEVPFCGHATIAAAKVVFDKRNLVSTKVEVLEFETPESGVMRAFKSENGFNEIQLPLAVVEEVGADERERLSKLIHDAFGRDVDIKFIGKGGEGFRNTLLVEVDAKEDLKASSINANPLKETGCSKNILTTESLTGEEIFVSRMFAPTMLTSGEDHVCGSAHCLLTPYWFNKKNITEELGTATQVSKRGGKLKVGKGKEIVCIQGQACIFSSGTLYL